MGIRDKSSGSLARTSSTFLFILQEVGFLAIGQFSENELGVRDHISSGIRGIVELPIFSSISFLLFLFQGGPTISIPP